MARTQGTGQSVRPNAAWLRATRRTAQLITLAVLAMWRTRFPPTIETSQRRMAAAGRDLLTTDMHRAAEAFHWADASRWRESGDVGA